MKWQIYWQIYPLQMSIDPLNTTTPKLADQPPWHLVVKNGAFTFLMLEHILADEMADLSPQYWHLMVKNGDFTLLLLEQILAGEVADLLADLPSLILASSDQEW